MGLFADWQGLYAGYGIATFPVHIDGKDKRPALSNYLKLGTVGSQKLIPKFGECDAFGLALKPSRITVLDVDTKDQQVLIDAMSRYGRSPFIVRSGSGHYHAWYRHNGEARLIRPWGPSIPIDLLGDGFVVAPPSKSPHGSYDIIEGKLEDLRRLPSLQNLSFESTTHCGPQDARVGEGQRNDALFHFCMREAHNCGSMSELLQAASRHALKTFEPALPDDEISRTVRSAWGYTERGENRFGAGNRVEITHDEVDALLGVPDAFILLAKLRRHHWGSSFVVANALAGQFGPKGWPRKRLAAARRVLEEHGKIIMIRRPSKAAGPALYRWPKWRPGQ